MVGSSH